MAQQGKGQSKTIKHPTKVASTKRHFAAKKNNKRKEARGKKSHKKPGPPAGKTLYPALDARNRDYPDDLAIPELVNQASTNVE